MKRFVMLMVAVAMMALLPVGSAFAQDPAYETPFTTSITYQNVSSNTADISITLYNASGTPIQVPDADTPNLAAGAGASISVGAVGGGSTVPSGFEGAGILASDQPVVATLVQVPSSNTVKNRPLSNGFSSDQASDRYLIATVLKGTFGSNTTFSVQNADSQSVTIDVVLTPLGGGSPININDTVIPFGAAHYFDVAQMSQVPAGFNGAATITAEGGRKIVASALEASVSAQGISSFEGVTQGGRIVYMATGLCDTFGQRSAYAVQNTGSGQTNVTVTYKDLGGAVVGSQTKTIDGGSKQSFVACDASGVNAGFTGSATITSTAQDVVAIGKVYQSGLSTAFLGATEGASELSLPYVRFAPDAEYANGSKQRAYLAIQNVGTASIPAGQLRVEYRDKNGNLVGTHTNEIAIAPGSKFNSHANLLPNGAGLNFGYVGGFGGGAIVKGPAGSQLVAIARILSRVNVPGIPSQVGEDYNGIPTQ